MNFEERRTSFGSVAAEYERARPGYSDEAVTWLATTLGIGVGRDVLDLGAGTGKLTRQVLALGARVVAVEPDARMRAELERAVPEARALEGAAEALPLPDASVDAVVCGQAFHWFDAASALREISRVLRPGGSVGLLWNVRDEADPFQAALSEIVYESDRDWKLEGFFRDAVAESSLFGDIDRAAFAHEQMLAPEQLVDRVTSMSAVATLNDPERAEVFRRVEELAGTVRGPIRFAYVTQAYAFRCRD